MSTPESTVTVACARARRALDAEDRASLTEALTDIAITLIATSAPGTPRRSAAVRVRAAAAAAANGIPLADLRGIVTTALAGMPDAR